MANYLLALAANTVTEQDREEFLMRLLSAEEEFSLLAATLIKSNQIDKLEEEYLALGLHVTSLGKLSNYASWINLIYGEKDKEIDYESFLNEADVLINEGMRYIYYYTVLIHLTVRGIMARHANILLRVQDYIDQHEVSEEVRECLRAIQVIIN